MCWFPCLLSFHNVTFSSAYAHVTHNWTVGVVRSMSKHLIILTLFGVGCIRTESAYIQRVKWEPYDSFYFPFVFRSPLQQNVEQVSSTIFNLIPPDKRTFTFWKGVYQIKRNYYFLIILMNIFLIFFTLFINTQTYHSFVF